MTPRSGRDRGETSATAAGLPRFARSTRVFHWVHAIPFLFLLLTGLLIFLVPSVKAFHLGGYRVVALLHVIAGIGFIASVPVVALLTRERGALRDDVQQALTPEPGDIAWLRYAVRSVLGAKLPQPASGKYNAGQKLSTLFWWAVTAGLTLTGAVLAVNYVTKRVFSAAFVETMFPWHDALTILSLPVLAAHLYLSLVNPGTRPSLRGMLSGRVDAAWARRHHARWVAEEARRAEEET